MAKIGNLSVAITANTVGLAKGLGSATKRLGGFARRGIGRVSGAVSNLTSQIAGVAGIGGALSAIGSVGWGVKLAADAEMAHVGFTTLLGSSEAATEMLNDLRQFAATTPFQFPELADTTKRMLAMGFSAEQVPTMLQTIGDAASALGGGTEVMQGMVVALGQMQAKGKVSAEEMNQLAERGVPAWKFLAEQIGVSIPEAMKMAEQGAIKASEAVPAILEGMNKQFAGGMAAASETIQGRWSTLKDNVGLAMMQMGQAIIEGFDLKRRIEDVTEFVKFVPAAFHAIAAAAQVIWDNIGGVIMGTIQNAFAAWKGYTLAVVAGLKEIWNQGSKIFDDLGALVIAFAEATGAALEAAFDLEDPIKAFRKTFDREFSERTSGAFKDVGKAMTDEFNRVFDANKSDVPGDVLDQAKKAFQDSLDREDFSGLIKKPEVGDQKKTVKDVFSQPSGGGLFIPGVGLAVTGALVGAAAQQAGINGGPSNRFADLATRGSDTALQAIQRYYRGDAKDSGEETADNTKKTADLMPTLIDAVKANQVNVGEI